MSDVFEVVFDNSNIHWNKDPEHNRYFLQSQQNYFNHLLHARGHVFLNEIHDALGLDRTSKGQLVGWSMSGEGDSFIDFGLSAQNEMGEEVTLTFNVDGEIYQELDA